jgi:DNA-binding MarR family transcriptional regulator
VRGKERKAEMPRQKKTGRAPSEGAGGGPAIDLGDHIATRIAIFSNRVSRAASRFYRERYGIGVVEWRVLMFIGRAGETSANRICSETDLDKGAVSRSLNVLARMGIVSIKEDGADSRRHNIALTARGRALHDRIVPVALERQRELLHDLSPVEVETLKDIIRRMQARVADGKAAPEKPAPKRPPAARPAVRRSARRGELPRPRASVPRG